ncbi:MAG: RrF2 family transcriptional regulator [Lachnospiraceae bacterium]|uniref:RrF2 family transcriptional regulator n=1 Tax=Parablautia sp. Marseille-Q6255 TaxID=3039593 RepID=UPI0024BBF20B|nr:Rrf2 family transcriptional regulator [Parablautia sp. Marseille-Q6255]
MKVSTKGRYALRMMLDLATNQTGEPVRLRDVARRQKISEKYLEQIAAILNKAGFVRSVRGPQGGYLLQKVPEAYTVGMILRLTEGSLAPVGCVGEDPAGFCAGECQMARACVTRRLWKQLNDAINGVVDRVTLADLLAWQAEAADDYVI